MAQRLKIKPAGRMPGYHWTAEQRKEIRQRTLRQCAERKEKRQQVAPNYFQYFLYFFGEGI